MSSGTETTSDANKIVLRNTAYLGIAEILSLPISIVLNGMIGRYLGPENLGHVYLATTIASLAFLFVVWGHNGSLPAIVALDSKRAGKALGSTTIWRVVSGVAIYLLVRTACSLQGFTSVQQWAIGLTFITVGLTTLSTAFQDTMRGFERADVAAYARVGQQLAQTLIVIPVLLLGGQLVPTLIAQSLAVFVVLAPLPFVVRRMGVGALRFDWAELKELCTRGTPFLFFGIALVLQPNVDAYFLRKYSPAEVLGWFAVSTKLVGFLLMPASVLISALYPTLCRLFATDLDGFKKTTRDSLSSVALLVFPVAIGCGFFPEVGVSIYGRAAYLPSEDNLRVSALFVFLVFFSMPIGTALLAAGRQKLWTFVQLFCVVNSLVLDPFLVSHFQARTGNGGIGLAAVSVISETMMVSLGIFLLPRGVFDRQLLRSLALTATAGAAMAGTAFALRRFGPFVGVPLSVVAYAAALRVTGAISAAQLESLRGMVRRKLSRA